MPQSITNKTLDKPKKPFDGFPLFPHATRRWAKKIRGKLCYFGPWDDPQGALQRFLDQKDDLYAGRRPRAKSDGLTLRELCNKYLTAKKHRLVTGEITNRTFQDYHRVCARILDSFGRGRIVIDLTNDDFERLRSQIAGTWGPVGLGNEINRVRMVFKYGYDAGLLDQPVRYGPNFRRPSRKVLRQVRNASGERMFEAPQIRRLLKATRAEGERTSQDRPDLRAMIFLAINCGFGNADVGLLPRSAVNLNAGWVSFPRPKTGIRRRCALWPETAESLELSLAAKRASRDPKNDELVFLTTKGRCWHNDRPSSPLSAEFRKFLQRIDRTDEQEAKREGKAPPKKLHRLGLGFYALRHTFETIAGEAKDQVAVDHIMGHARDDMASVYRERISDGRLAAVTDYVREWLFNG